MVNDVRLYLRLGAGTKYFLSSRTKALTRSGLVTTFRTEPSLAPVGFGFLQTSAAPLLHLAQLKTTKPQRSLRRRLSFNVKEVAGNDRVSGGDQGDSLTVMRSCWRLRAAETLTSD